MSAAGRRHQGAIMTVVLGIVAILVIVNPIVQGVLTAIQVGVTTDQSISWPAEGCPVHRIDGSVKYSCKHRRGRGRHAQANRTSSFPYASQS
jgi:hypothetical protein